MKLILVIHVVGQTCYCSDCLSGAGFAANTQESTSVDPQARPNGHSVASDRISNQEIRYDQEKKETPVCLAIDLVRQAPPSNGSIRLSDTT